MSELRKYGVLLTTAKAIQFTLFQVDGVDFEPAATFAAGDVKISKDGGAEVNTANLPTDEGQGYRLILTAAELTAKRIRIFIVDQTATKVWLDIEINIETYGNAAAMHIFDLDTAAATMRGTDNAALASVCTETRLSELAAANMPADLTLITTYVDELETRLSVVRAGYLDNLSAGAVALQATLTALNNISTAQVNTEVDNALADFFTSAAQLVIDFWSDTLTTYTNGMAGKRLKGLSAATVVEGTVNDASATTTSFITTLTGYGTDFFVDTEIAVEIAADQWQPRVVTAYNTTTGLITIDEALISAPADSSNVSLTMRHIHSISAINAEMDTAILDGDIATETKQDVINNLIDAIKVITDQMVFTKANELDSNIRSVNDVTITGNGSTVPFDV